MNDQEFNVKFVEEVKRNEVLYNYNLPGYSRKQETEKAWQKVGFKMNMTATECKKRWKNLRSVFIRRLKPNEPGSNKRSYRAYYLADSMQFCVPYIKVLQYSELSELKTPKTEMDDINSENSEISDNDNKDFFESVNITQSPHTSPSPQPYLIQTSCSSPPAPPDAETDKCMTNYFKGQKETAESTSTKSVSDTHFIEKEEALKMFLLSLLPELKGLNDFQIKIFKRRIFTLIDDIST